MKPYTPQQDSIAWKVIEFFTTNPDEALTTQDLEAKFDKKACQFHSLLGAAVEAGVLKRGTDLDDDLVYSLGTGTPVVKPNRARNPTPRPDALLAGSNLGLKRPANACLVAKTINVDEIPMRADVPMPSKQQTVDWNRLFGRMKVEDSCVLPMAVRPGLNKACTEAKKAGLGVFSIRKIDDEQLGLWRVK